MGVKGCIWGSNQPIVGHPILAIQSAWHFGCSDLDQSACARNRSWMSRSRRNVSRMKKVYTGYHRSTKLNPKSLESVGDFFPTSRIECHQVIHLRFWSSAVWYATVIIHLKTHKSDYRNLDSTKFHRIFLSFPLCPCSVPVSRSQHPTLPNLLPSS